MPVTEIALNITMSLLVILAVTVGALTATRLKAQQHGEGRAGRRGPASSYA